jgi:hypothetical protein
MPKPVQPVLDWIDEHAAVFVIVGMVAVGANIVLGVHTEDRAGKLEQTTCTIQDRGLKAGPHLTRAMQDIGTLLTPLPGEKAASIPAPLVAPLANLREELGAYVQIEHEQPPFRSC